MRIVTIALHRGAVADPALLGGENFLTNFEDFLLLVLYLFIPWTAVNLVDYYIVRRGHYAIAEIFNPHGMYGRWGWRGITAYLVGFAAMVPFFEHPQLRPAPRPSAARTSRCSSACRSLASCTTCSPTPSTWPPRREWPRPRRRNSRRPRGGTNDRYDGGVSSPSMPMTALGRSDLRVSRLALGSWRTFERISRDQGVRVMRAAREAGINFLDDARYNDETGHAPLPTGYSEVVFGELFRAAGWRRDEVVVSNKLWWEFWPDQSPAQELAGSLGRMGLDHVDLIYSDPPPDGVGVEDAVGMITGLIAPGPRGRGGR